MKPFCGAMLGMLIGILAETICGTSWGLGCFGMLLGLGWGLATERRDE